MAANNVTTVNVLNVISYYGFVDVDVLKEVLQFFPNVRSLTLWGKTYTTSESDLVRIIDDVNTKIPLNKERL